MAADDPVLAPYQYELLWRIAHFGPLTAGEVADTHNLPQSNKWCQWTPQAASNRLRVIARAGLIERTPGGFWRLTERGAAWIEVR